MLRSQEIELRIAALNRELYADGTTKERMAEIQTEAASLTADLQSVRQSEADAVNRDFAGHTGQLSSEHREAQTIAARANLAVLVDNLLGRRAMASGSAEAEAQAAWGVGSGEIPYQMLGVDMRATTAPDSQGQGAGAWLAYTFPRSIQAAARIARPQVPAGVHSFPSFSAASSASRPADGAAVSDSDATVRAEMLVPNRVQVSTQIRREDMARYAGMGAAIAAHLAGAVAAGLDQQALVGDEGFFDSSSGPLTMVAATATDTFATATSKMYGSVDGQFSGAASEIALIIGSATYGHWAGLYRGANSDVNAARHMEAAGTLYVSSGMPAVGSNKQSILAVRGAAQGAVQPLWQGVSLEDPYSGSGNGEVKFTAIMLSDFSVQQQGAYRWLESQHA